MITLRLCRITLLRLLAALAIISFLIVPPAYSLETEDSQVFIAGFNAFQQKEYATAISKMSEVLQKYPDTPLRDMALFWLSRSYYKAGNQQDAARYLSQFSKEYPDNPLKGTVEEELLALTARYERGEKLLSVAAPDKTALRKTAAEQERLAAQKAEQERIALLKAETERKAAEAAAAEKARLAAAQQEQQRIAAEAAAKAKAEQLAKAEQERMVAQKAEQERIATLKAETERKVAEAAAAEKARLVAAQQEQQRIAAEAAAKAKAEQLAKAEQERLAAQKAEQERIALLKAETERKAAEAAAAEKARLAAAQQEQQRIAAEAAAKAKAEQLAKAEQERLAAVKAEQQQVAGRKTESERKAFEAATAKVRAAEEKVLSVRKEYREKAIAQYKAIIGTYPGSAAATTAAAKLRELGLAVALPPVAVAETLPENAQVLRLEVAQYAGFEFNLLSRPEAITIARPVAIPFEIINRGNGSDSFYLESSFPTDFKASFAATAQPDVAISQTPVLLPGESFKGAVMLSIPASSIDGLRITHPVKVVSRLMTEASQSREVRLVASAPLIRAVVKVDKNHPLPGEKLVYRIAVLNVGSTTAQDVTFRLNFPPQLEPVDHVAAGFRQEMKSALVFDGLQVKSGESREFSVTFQLKEDSLAGQEISARAELIDNLLKRTSAFVSTMAYVQSQRNILVRSGSERLVIIPGQTISVPFVVTNTGNVREKFKVSSLVKGVQDAVVFHDINRDGIRQTSEPLITEIGPLAPKEEANVVVEIKTPRSADDGSQGSLAISFTSEGDATRMASGTTQLVYSRPVLQLGMTGRDGRMKPGEVATYNLTMTNKGSNLARVVELQSAWPEQLELVAADPANTVAADGRIIWRFKELGAGERRSIKVSFRVKPGTGVGTSIQVKNILNYEDQLGNRY